MPRTHENQLESNHESDDPLVVELPSGNYAVAPPILDDSEDSICALSEVLGVSRRAAEKIVDAENQEARQVRFHEEVA